MADILIDPLVIGEVVPIYGHLDAASGTLTISASPAPTYSLYDASGVVVTGHSAQTVTGYDATALDTVMAWNTLDTSALTAGWYRMEFTIKATSSVDSIARTRKASVAFLLKAVGA